MSRPAGNVFRLVEEQRQSGHLGHDLTVRSYPYLEPPATFVDCWTCGRTWEVAKAPKTSGGATKTAAPPDQLSEGTVSLRPGGVEAAGMPASAPGPFRSVVVTGDDGEALARISHSSDGDWFWLCFGCWWRDGHDGRGFPTASATLADLEDHVARRHP